MYKAHRVASRSFTPPSQRFAHTAGDGSCCESPGRSLTVLGVGLATVAVLEVQASDRASQLRDSAVSGQWISRSTDAAFEVRLVDEIRRLFPRCPAGRALAIAENTSLRGSGRVGRSAAGRAAAAVIHEAAGARWAHAL